MAKITIVHHSGVIGGGGVSLISIIKALAPYHDLTVLLSDSPDDIIKGLTRLQKDYNFQIESYGRRIGAITYYNGGDNLLSLRFIYRLSLVFKQWSYWQRKIKELDSDIVIVNSIILSWMGLLPEVKRRKSICFVRETIKGSLTLWVNKIIRKFLLKFGRVVFLSDYDRRSWNFEHNQSEIIRDFISDGSLDNSTARTDASGELGLLQDSFHVLYVGGVSYMKGFDLVVKAVIELNKTIDTELVVAGVDFNDRKVMGGGKLNSYEESIAKFIAQNKYRDKIHIIGRQTDMSCCYASSDVLVFPMRSAHQARPIFEAGYFSIPVIISDFENIKENIINNESGLLFKSENVSDLISKLKTIALDPALKNTMGQKNKLLYEANHSMKKNNMCLLKLVAEL